MKVKCWAQNISFPIPNPYDECVEVRNGNGSSFFILGPDPRPEPDSFTKRGFFFFFSQGPLSPARFEPKSWPNQKKKRNHWSPKKELKNKRHLFFAPFLFPLQHHLCADPLPINWVCKVTQHRNSKSF